MSCDAISALLERQPRLACIEERLRRAVALLINCFEQGKGLLLCGNGGSAADAEHWAGELLKGFESRRLLPAQQWLGADAELLGQLQGGLPAVPLSGFTALRSAVANDMDPRLEYAQLVTALGRPGWILVALSTSGNAANVCCAAQVARAKGMPVLALTGHSGGRLAELADCCLQVPEQRTCLVQELHLPVYHALCLQVEAHVFSDVQA